MESGLRLLIVVPPFPLKQTALVLKPDSHRADPASLLHSRWETERDPEQPAGTDMSGHLWQPCAPRHLVDSSTKESVLNFLVPKLVPDSNRANACFILLQHNILAIQNATSNSKDILQLTAGWQETESSHLLLSLSGQTEITHLDLISSS